jgi:hypothetical protein
MRKATPGAVSSATTIQSRVTSAATKTAAVVAAKPSVDAGHTGYRPHAATRGACCQPQPSEDNVGDERESPDRHHDPQRCVTHTTTSCPNAADWTIRCDVAELCLREGRR